MVNLSLLQDKAIVLIDGECDFCNKSALYIIKHDGKDKFRFASQQSDIGMFLMKKNNYHGNSLSTIILINNKKVYTKTTALIEIAKHLVGFPKIFILMKIIPTIIRDFFYDAFSKYRYELFGKRNNCSIPSKDIKAKFLSYNHN